MIDPALYEKYSQEQIDKAVNFLSYHDAKPLPKNEDARYPIMYVFRHGQTTDNADFLFSGWRDVELTEKGVEQAQVLAEKLADKKIDMLITSDQRRSVQTMQIAISKNIRCKGMEMHKDPRIKERSYGDLQGTSKLLVYLENPELAHEYRRSYSFKPPNGESVEEVVKRVTGFIEEIIPLMKMYRLNVAISCHGNSMRGFRQYFDKLSNEEAAEIETLLGQDYAAYSIQ